MPSTSAVDEDYIHRWQVSWAKTNPLASSPPFLPAAVLTVLGQVHIQLLMSGLSLANVQNEVSQTLAALESCNAMGVVFSVFPRVCHSLQHSSSSFTKKMEVCVFSTFPSLLTNICLIGLYVTIVE